ncbi:50S ribosomal protein L24 [Candidatus Tachikawaea gelatinosa]|uniref:Large ribosomal subunit protein uL24 n=1 Tax=Candidatus Tachikawaea gelatinosa TaxID=1410383 RepID=A0A090AL75_9ENTR|nr:50S ribosomal protein L24 [Candidatus Tachikawaea gelatinosa]BAP58364.1 50S ribosomal protein L24 [Candidatus Tachikawaea gelatinosa]
MAKKIRKNDEVIVIAGRCKNQRGKVKKILSNKKVIVEGINLVTKHKKPIPSLQQEGGIYKEESYIDISNIAIINTKTDKLDKVGFKFENGKKVRFFKSNNKIIK